jgi:hypothetical protein
VVLPRPIKSTGVNISHGQSAGWLGAAYEPFHLNADPAAAFDRNAARDRAQAFGYVHDSASNDAKRCLAFARRAEPAAGVAALNAFDLHDDPAWVRDAYGRTTFGQSCLLARRLVESGVRFVTVNMFDTVFNRVTWDCHGTAPFCSLEDYARELLPTFDQAFAALLDDLKARGRLDSTLVLAAGEFGRTPRVNATGGRDHWPGVWSVALAGGGVQGGQVIGSSDAHASIPADRPVTAQDLLATIYHSSGIEETQILKGADGELHALVDHARPVWELFNGGHRADAWAPMSL